MNYPFSTTTYLLVDLKFSSFGLDIIRQDSFMNDVNHIIPLHMLPFINLYPLYFIECLINTCLKRNLEFFGQCLMYLNLFFLEQFTNYFLNLKFFLKEILSNDLFYLHSLKLRTHQVFFSEEFYPIYFHTEYLSDYLFLITDFMLMFKHGEILNTIFNYFDYLRLLSFLHNIR